MGRLIATGITSLDGYVNDDSGNFDWAAPDAQVHAFVNERERNTRTHLYGRRMYETMRYWETAGGPDEPAVEREWAELWRGLDKIVYSSTLDSVQTSRTRLERSFDPAAVRALKEAATHDLGIGGAGLAAEAFRAGLVDVVQQYVSPVVVGGGTRFLPEKVRLELELTDEVRFGNGVVFLEYRVR
ncbi:deaminase [Virgisporangium aliadipatigenens]|uniref:Deaminase n=1 Tax=Virgisporangium aliadipatigenens TaxID=741659 RepID=A0A8J4DS00_9ACTN|nr:dihydrofolate reductase family protein [Virgisporangium aliadipatigenens]GIJ46797.1 deaminase [Virgisporangium aliadipatigenens]